MKNIETNNNNNNKFINWGDSNEKILKSWSDKSKCYNQLHNRAYKKYNALNSWFTIPVIIITTITGTSNFAQDSIDPNYKNFFLYLIGGLNLFSAITIAINSKLKLAQLSEAHKILSTDWDKFSRNLKLELSKNRNERVDCNTFMKSSQQEYDNLKANSPDIPNDVIRWFRLIIKNGYEENINSCQMCIYESFCFPCGLDCCYINFRCFCKKKKKIQYKNNSDIELPDIVNGIKPTIINIIDEELNNEYNIF